jgi:hypothetical protein
MLFMRRSSAEFRRPSIGAAQFLGDTDYSDWPLEPIEVVDGVPFLITRGYMILGLREPADSYLRYCMANSDWNCAHFREPSTKQKRDGLCKLLASTKWKRSLNTEEREFLSAQLD